MSKYTTVQGDTWDIIALKQCGNERYMHLLIAENPVYRETVFFKAGVSLTIPTIDIPTPIMPPWKRKK